MLVLAEATPNPLTMKFSPGREVMPLGSAEFARGDDVSSAPLAAAVLAVPGVASVMLGRDFLSVSADGGCPWDSLRGAVSDAIRSHFIANPSTDAPAATVSATADPRGIVARIKEILDARVRPSLASDGGDVTFADYRDGVLYLSMHGACNGCPSLTATLKIAILNALRRAIPEVTDVRAA